jgi:gamma-glutamyltranspeptidase/glutathione hydrolase
VQAAVDVVDDGGNAVDAALAAMVMAMTTEPGIVSVLGGAFVAVWPAGGEPEVIDGNVEMPGRGVAPDRFGAGLREVHTTYGGGLTLYAGHGSAATPGAFAALGLAHERHAAAPWGRVLEPSAAACRAGYPVGAAAASYLSLTGESVFGWDPQSRAQVTREDGTPVRAGDVKRAPDLADTLDLLTREGYQSIYTGTLAEAIAADADTRGGLISAADLAAYRAVVREPILQRLGRWDVATNPPPAVGGPMLAVMLRELAARPDWDWPDVIEVQRAVLGYRQRVHDRSRDLLTDGHALLEAVERYGLAGLPTSASTAHVSAVDSDGNACAITASSGYGSGATVPGTGMLLNNCLGEPELNRLGLHALEPGTRLASNMAPSVGRTDDRRALAVGSPGADRITTALMQVLGQFCLAGLPLQGAIDRPRVHVKVLEDGSATVEHEDHPDLAPAIEACGLPAVAHPALSMYFGGVGAALLGRGGELSADADPRRDGAVAVTVSARHR